MGEIDSPRGAGGRPGEVRVVTRALWGIARDVADDRVLAERICRACVEGLDIDGAAISLFTVRTTAKPCSPPTRPPCCSKICSSASVRGRAWTRLPAGARCGRPTWDPAETIRWPIYAAAVVEQAQVQAVFALPRQWGAINLGVLDLYRVARGPLSGSQ